jgi:OFA family oxalate/formate antiporter-like MFS transporter
LSTFYGWWIVVAAFLAVVFVFGVPTVILPVLYSPIIDEFGWTRAEVTLIATMKFSAGAVMGIVVGFLVDRISIRKIVVLSSLLSGATMVGFLWIRTLWHFYALGLLLGFGSLGVMVSMKVLVSRWFTLRQGVAVGIALLGTSIAGSFAPALASQLIDVVGWRQTVAILSFGNWGIALPVFLWLAKDHPDDSVSTREELGGDSDIGAGLGEMLRGPTFWALALGVFLIGFVDQAMTQHTVLYLDKDQGLGRSVASIALSFVFFMSIAGKIGFGWVYDKLSLRGISLCYWLMALSVLLAFPAQAVVSLALFGIVRGLAHGGSIVDIPVMSKHCFGPKVLGRSIGLLTASVTLGFAAGPPLLGYLYDVQGSYRTGFYLLIGMSLAAGLVLFAARPDYRQRLS